MRIENASDCKSMTHEELSNAFWDELGKYNKHPNPESLNNIERLWEWACHASHELSKAFTDAMKWSKIYPPFDEWDKHGWEYKSGAK